MSRRACTYASAVLYGLAVFGSVAGRAQDACSTGDQALASARWSEANDAYQACVRANPSFAVYSNMGVALSHMGRMKDAIDSYSKALNLDPSNSKIEFNLSVALIKESNYAAAADHLKHLQRSGNDVRYDELLAFCYYHLQSYSLAARAAERVYSVNPSDPANALILGSTYERMGLYEKALPLITLALKSAGSAEGHLILAQTLNGLHRYPEAESELKQIETTDQNFAGLHEAMGEVYVGTERTPQAEVEFAKAIEEDPNDFEANYFLGRLKRFDGDMGSANRYLAAADRLNPNSSVVAHERAEIAMKEGRFADAVPLLEAVIKSDPEQAQAYLSLAEAYQHIGRRADAQREGELYNTKLRESHERMAAQDHPSRAQENP
jgi:tetratricopeptide (TPR) repeat protein